MAFLLTRRTFGAALLGAGVCRLSAAAPVRWAWISDLHIPTDTTNEYRGFRPYDNLKRIVPEIVAAKPDGVLACGDLARLEGKAGDYQNLKALLAPVAETAPLALVLGNHDDRKNFLAAFGTAQKGAQALAGRHVVAIETAAARFVVLDSLLHPNVTPGLLGQAQRAWLGQYLAAASDLPTLLFVHHSLDDNDGSLMDVARLFEIVKPHRKVKAIVYGHSHRYAFDTQDGIHLINLPAVGYNFSDREPVGWVEAAIEPGGGTFTLHAFVGNKERDGKPVKLAWLR
jgi:3',5'-cyclic AMP phosphodiesterase CpdA